MNMEKKLLWVWSLMGLCAQPLNYIPRKPRQHLAGPPFQPPTSSKKSFKHAADSHALKGVQGYAAPLTIRYVFGKYTHSTATTVCSNNGWTVLQEENHVPGTSPNVMLQCVSILLLYSDNSSLVFTSSWLSLFARASEHFRLCWGLPKHIDPSWGCEGRTLTRVS